MQAAAAYDQRDALWELWANTQFSKDHCEDGMVPGSAPDVVLDDVWRQLGLSRADSGRMGNVDEGNRSRGEAETS